MATFDQNRRISAGSAPSSRPLRSFAAIGLLVASLMGSSLSQADAPHRKHPNWVGTWATATQASTSSDLQFSNQTLRQIVHTSIGGNEVRVTLSNSMGTTPLVVRQAHVALRANGAAIQPSSDRRLSFGGLTSVTIPPGASMVSDPVELNVAPQSDLAISIFLPQTTAATTTHSLARQTNYVSLPGNFTDAPVLPVASTTQSWYFLGSVDVVAPKQASAIVTLGDSITDGVLATSDANRRWPDRLAQRLQADRSVHTRGVLNLGISGNRVLNDFVGPSALTRFDRDVLGQAGVSHLIVMEGINDIGFASFRPDQVVSAEQIIAGHKQIIMRAKTHGLTVLGATLTPFEGAGYYSQEGEAKRQAVNAWIRSSGAYDGVIDFDRALRDPSNPTQLNPRYDSGDHLHPNDAGFQAMANAVNLKLLR